MLFSDEDGSSIKKRNLPLQGRRFSLTIHGAKSEDLESLSSFFDTEQVTLACVAWQSGEHHVHPHWQCYFQLAERTRMKDKIKEILGHQAFHLERAVATTKQNINYVYAVRKQHELGWIHYAKNVQVPDLWSEPLVLKFHHSMKQWQSQIVSLIKRPADSRTIYWFWEPIGNVGKTLLAKYLHYLHGAIVTGGNSSDMKYAVSRWKQITGSYPVTIIVDIFRSVSQTDVNYRGLEELKNSLFFSGKYESGMVASKHHPHIIIFSNSPPKIQALSLDRWKIFYINDSSDSLEESSL